MKRFNVMVGEGAGGRRIDLFLLDSGHTFVSRAEVQRLVKGGHVLVNGHPCKNNHRVHEGEEIEVEIPPPKPSHLLPEDIPVKVIYEDSELIVVDKPVGLVTHPGAGRPGGTLINALLFHCKTLAASEDPLRPGIVHRLDKDSSGLLVVAKTAQAHVHLALQFKNRTIERFYRAFVWGKVEFDEGKIEEPIGRHPRHPKKMAVVRDGGKRAITLYRVIRRYKDVTDLEVKIMTGRTHQIRVHLAHLGYPVIGDTQYGRRDTRIDRSCLHAFVLGFKHPVTGERLSFKSPLPPDMERFLKHLQLDQNSGAHLT